MERYTKKNTFNEEGGYMVNVEDVNIMWDGNHMVHGGSHIDRLAEYENTGFTPEQLDSLFREISMLKAAIIQITHEEKNED